MHAFKFRASRLLGLACALFLLAGPAGAESQDSKGLPGIKDGIAGLIKLKLHNGGALTLDREIWSKFRKSEDEVIAQIKRESGMWRHGETEEELTRKAVMELRANSSRYLNVPSAAFERFASACGGAGAYSRSFGEGDALDSRFDNMRVRSSIKVSAEAGVRVNVVEFSGLAQNILAVRDDPDGSFYLFLFLGGNGPVLKIEQSSGGKVTVSLFEDGVRKVREAEDFKKMMSEKNSFVKTEVVPLLALVGIQGL